MPSPDLIYGDRDYRGAVRFGGSVVLPTGFLTNAQVSPSAGIAASKLVHQRKLHYRQATGTAVVAETAYDWHILYGAGTLISLGAAITGAIATGGDRTVTLDLQRSTAGGAFATVLSSPLVLDNANVLRVAEYAAGFSSTTLLAGDLLRLTVAVAGAAGAQAQGLVVVCNFEENPS